MKSVPAASAISAPVARLVKAAHRVASGDLTARVDPDADPGEIAVEIVAGREASASFDMQSLTSLHHGDRIVVRRSEHQARFLHPKGWNYFDTLREKLHWNKGSG